MVKAFLFDSLQYDTPLNSWLYFKGAPRMVRYNKTTDKLSYVECNTDYGRKRTRVILEKGKPIFQQAA